jgi:hypothetical protein
LGLIAFGLLSILPLESLAAEATVDYDIVYVRQPRYADGTNTIWAEVFHPARMEPGADLVLLHPDGSEEVLIEGGRGSVTDPFVSFDGEWVYFSYFYDLRPERLNPQRQHLPIEGADIFRIHLPSRRVEQLTFGEFTPNTGAGRWRENGAAFSPGGYNRLGYGVLNLGPCPLPGGRIAFTSNRNGFEPPKGYTSPTLQLFVMDEDGSNVTPIAPMSISSALHPTILRDGRLMYSSHESQGIRDRRNWGLWYISPDGRDWGPLVSAFREAQAFHFMTQLSNGDVVFEDYYNLNNNGFGALYRFPLPSGGQPSFFGASLEENPPIARTKSRGFSATFRMPFTPRGLVSITPLTHADDAPAPVTTAGRSAGKYTHPSGAPNNDLLVAYTDAAANHRGGASGAAYDSGIYLVPGGQPVNRPGQLIELKNDPRYNEAWPRAVVPYGAVHGVAEPAEIPWLPNDGTLHADLPAGTPYGLVGTSSFYKRETAPGRDRSKTFDGLEPFNTAANGANSNWHIQGADAGRYSNSDIWAVRILAMEPNTHRSYGPGEGRHFFSHASERLRILGEIPLRKSAADGSDILDPEGHPDTSFLAKIPADTPFTFQTLDRRGLVLNMAQTWHQVRPGEMRVDCGGCHAHSQEPLAFEGTAAAKADYRPYDLSKLTPMVTADAGGIALDERVTPLVNVEFTRDIRPILARSCTSCHTRKAKDPPADLVLDDRALYDGLPGDYARLANDKHARWGRPPVINGNKWRSPNASRYVRKFQSRRSLLTWKVFGERLDGWRNEDHPTESTPGVASTLPAGADPNEADIDFDGVICPPPGSAEPLSEEDKRTFARWIDLGAPIDLGNEPLEEGLGWYLDDLRPTLTVALPRPGPNVEPIETLRIGVSDAYSGIDSSSLSLIADFPVAGRPAGAELSDLARENGDGILEVPLGEQLPALDRGRLVAKVKDRAGNTRRVERVFSTATDLRREYTVASTLNSVDGIRLARHPRRCGSGCPDSDVRVARAEKKALPGKTRTAKREPSSTSTRARVAVASKNDGLKITRASRSAEPQAPSGSALFSDGFERKNSDKLGRHWTELESRSKARVQDQGVVFEAFDDNYRPMIAGRFQQQAVGTLVWEFDFDFRRIGPERSYSFWMQLGSGSQMDLDDPTASGVAINLLWGGPDQGLDTHEGFGYISRGVVAQLIEVSGKQRVRVEADLGTKTFTLSVAGEVVEDIPFNRDVPLDTVRFFAHRLNHKNFEGRMVDEVVVTRGADGLQVAKRPDTTRPKGNARSGVVAAPGL